LWRGVEIQNNYSMFEWDMFVNQSLVVWTQDHQSGTVRQTGQPYHIENSEVLEFWVLITSGPHTGRYIRTIGDTSGENGPQTSFATMAMSPAGGAAPTSIKDAMTNGVDKVFAWNKCIIDNPYCHYSLPDGSSSHNFRSFRNRQQHNNHHKAVENNKPVVRSAKALNPLRAKQGGKFYDKCSAYAAEGCQFCISHAECGWCSTNVQYSDGEIGTQCAGFQGNTSFICQGRYSTTSCEVGYICTSGSFQCIPTQPGDGMPQGVCLATCKPTPPPNPRVPQYTCNLETHQCVFCSADHCPGSMPQAQCEQLCPHPLPGPTPDMVGVWRGMYIQNNYPVGEIDLVLNMSGAWFYIDKALFFQASVISLGADVMLWTVQSAGALQGKQIGVLYQMATTFYGMYWQGTFALGIPDHGFPGGYNHPMFTMGEKELVLAQCLQAPCQFNPPA